MTISPTLSNVTLIIFFIGLIIVSAYLVKSLLLFRYIKQNLPEAWKALGSQNGWSMSTYANGIRYTKFLMLKKYKDLNDIKVIKAASVIRILMLISLVVVPIVFILVVIQIVYSTHATP